MYFNHVSSSHQKSSGEDLTVGAKRNLTVLLASGEYCVNLDTILTRSEQNGEISLGTYSQVLPHWTLDCDIFQSRVLSRNAPEKCRRLIMIGLYHHQLLIWPRLIQKASPQLRMKPGARCCRWGHYRDPTTHFSTSLSQLLQGNPIDSFQFLFQWCLFLCYSSSCIDCVRTKRLTHRLHRLHQSHPVSYQRCAEEGWEERVDLDNFLLMFVESALTGVVISSDI